jgi:predicted dehydrogenase
MTAALRFPGGISGRVTCSMFSSRLLRVAARVIGDDGRLDVLNPLQPTMFHRLTVRRDGHKQREKVPGDTTYTHQLRAFVAAVTEGGPVLTSPADAVANMRVIDDVYRAAGLEPRQP